MNAPSRRDIDVLIVGAGPTGLVLGLWLTHMGVRTRIIDKTSEPGTTSRALGVQARTLELYRQVGLADTVVEHGRKSTAANFWVAGKHKARMPFGDIGTDLSPYPYALIYPQDEHERLLIGALGEAGVQVERQTELVSFEDMNDRVRSHLKRADGAEETCDASFIAGCDGARSIVREKLGIGFEGGAYAHLFYVADVEARGTVMNGEIHVGLDATDFLALFPLKAQGRTRLVGTVREEAEHEHENLSWNDVSKRVVQWMKIEVERVNWFSTYRVHHRVADHFRRGRAFILGDAAHIHSPVGAQGMNTGIGDAINLAWKLAAVVHGRAHASILDSFEPERIAFARRLVATTDRVFSGVTNRSATAQLLRLRIMPLLIPPLFKLAAVRRFVFRTVSQTMVNYRGSSLSEGQAGTIQGGDRLPWIRNANGAGADNFTPLSSMDWQVHVYGDAASDLRFMCKARNLPLHTFAWRPDMEQAGFARNAIYLIRPDGYVGLADTESNTAAVASYLDKRNLAMAPQVRARHVLAEAETH
jgi:2-polyprenyl-6-methoxyphenol hydroxylase-like FAD-dependent oxidoreductase